MRVTLRNESYVHYEDYGEGHVLKVLLDNNVIYTVVSENIDDKNEIEICFKGKERSEVYYYFRKS